ncbi:L-tyrosine/L-tryptophan isonitrile synthase family protein [Candidatus Daviesbacteria bacterium]|nr:L-tyrosine/L-tryptophan isonitrile synthase family protein [Candidatus Daviesbacteria bacterium]
MLVETYQNKIYEREKDRFLAGFSKPGVDTGKIIIGFIGQNQDQVHIVDLPTQEALLVIADIRAGQKAVAASRTLAFSYAQKFLFDKGVSVPDLKARMAGAAFQTMMFNIGVKHPFFSEETKNGQTKEAKRLTPEGRILAEAMFTKAHPKGVDRLLPSILTEVAKPANNSFFGIFGKYLGSTTSPQLQSELEARFGWYQAAHLPLELVLVLSLEKFPCPLKSFDGLPDLAEVGQLLKFKKLQEELRDLHPAGIKLIVVNESPAFLGFSSNPEVKTAEIEAYKNKFLELAQKLGIGGSVQVEDMEALFRGSKREEFDTIISQAKLTEEELDLHRRIEFTNVDLTKLFSPEMIASLSIADLLAIYSGRYSIAGFDQPQRALNPAQSSLVSAIESQATFQAEAFKAYCIARSAVQNKYLAEFGVTRGPYIKINCIEKSDQAYFPLSDSRVLPQHGVGVLTTKGKIKVIPLIVPVFEAEKYLLVEDPDLEIKYLKEVA